MLATAERKLDAIEPKLDALREKAKALAPTDQAGAKALLAELTALRQELQGIQLPDSGPGRDVRARLGELSRDAIVAQADLHAKFQLRV